MSYCIYVSNIFREKTRELPKSGAKVLLFFYMCKYFDKKMQIKRVFFLFYMCSMI